MSAPDERLIEVGQTPGLETVHLIRLSGGGLKADILTYGATLRDLRLDGHEPPLVLGFPSLQGYFGQSPYFGATVGRFSNRIAGGRYTQGAQDFQLDCNEDSTHHLHGGADGVSWRVWHIEERSDNSVTLAIDCADGHMGYPGKARLKTTYSLKADGTLSLRHETIAEKSAPASLTHHSYFILDDGPTLDGHDVEIAAERYLPTSADAIPTGAIAPVEATPFDFRRMRSLEIGKLGNGLVYDHNFCLADRQRAKTFAARVKSPKSGVEMEVATTEPGLQFYCGHKIATRLPGLTGRPYGAFAGLCLETQAWPDAPNRPEFPDAFATPGVPLVQETDYVFSKR